MKAYHLYLLRHGLTDGNEQGRYIGRLDPPLSGRGRRELEELAKQYEYPKAEAFFSSPRLRCTESLEILYPDAAPVLVPGLAECDFGEYEGKSLEELRDDPRYQRWASGMAKGDAAASPPGGESSADFQKRTCKAFGEIVARLTKAGVNRAVLMAHGGTIMTLLGVFGLPRRPLYEWMAGNGMGYEVLLTPQLWMNGRVVEVAGPIPTGHAENGAAGVDGLLDDLRGHEE